MAQPTLHTSPDGLATQYNSNPETWSGLLPNDFVPLTSNLIGPRLQGQSVSPVTLESLAEHLPKTPKKSLRDLAELHLVTTAEAMATDPAANVDIQQEPVAQSAIPSFGEPTEGAFTNQLVNQGIDYNSEQSPFVFQQPAQPTLNLNTSPQPATPTFFNIAPQVNQPATIFQPPAVNQATGPTFDPFVYQSQQQASFTDQTHGTSTGIISREMAQTIQPPTIPSAYNHAIINPDGPSLNSAPGNGNGDKPKIPKPRVPAPAKISKIDLPNIATNSIGKTSTILRNTKPNDSGSVQSLQKFLEQQRTGNIARVQG